MKFLLSLVLVLSSFLFAESSQKTVSQLMTDAKERADSTAMAPAFLAGKPSVKELTSRARDALKVALENGNLERAGIALEYLQENVKNGAALTRFEEYLVYSELNRYDDAIPIYASLRRDILDPDYRPEKTKRYEADDDLHQYLYRGLSPFNKMVADSLYNRAKLSDAKKENIDLYGVLLYAELDIGYNGYFLFVNDTSVANDFLKRANDFIYNYPMSEHSNYLSKQTVPFVKNCLQERRAYENDPWKDKYYTGGLGIYLGKWKGILGGDATDYLRDRMGTSFIIEAELQIQRVVFGCFWSYGMITVPKYKSNWDSTEDETMGLTVGATVFDSRFLKVTPFIGYGSMELMTIDDVVEPQLLLGLNVDSRLFISKPEHEMGLSFGLDVRFKYMLQIGSVEMLKASIINHTFAFEIGLIAW